MRSLALFVAAALPAGALLNRAQKASQSSRVAALMKRSTLNPGEIAEVLRAKSNSAKAMVNTNELPVACQAIQCANIADICPLDVVWEAGSCCPVCQTKGYKPGMKPVTDEYLVEMWQGAPLDSCKNVKCFRLQCPKGEKPSAPSGGCCKVCKKK